MSIEEAIYYKLTNDTDVAAIVSTRVYPMKLPPNPTYPAITYQRISTARWHNYAGASGRARPRFQIDCWLDGSNRAEAYDDARDLATKVRKCLDGFKGDIDTESDVGGVTLDSERDIWEDLAQVHRVTMDFIFPHFEST